MKGVDNISRHTDTEGRYLALDSGKTGCRVALIVDGLRVASARMPGLGTVADRGAPVRLEAGLEQVLERLRLEGQVDVVGVGMAGVFESWGNAPAIASIIQRVTGAERVVLTSDVVSTYCGVLGFEPGVVVAAGTGTVALAVAEDGSHARVDGWGYLLGDEGSGFVVGRAGLRSALRAHDGRGGSEVLRELAAERYGSLGRLAGGVHADENPSRLVAAFAPDVAVAARMGDAEAERIWERAAGDVARTAVAAARRVLEPGKVVNVSWSGGLFAERELLLAPFRREVVGMLPGARLVEPPGDALDGAGRLAATPVGGVLEPLLYRSAGSPSRGNAMQTSRR